MTTREFTEEVEKLDSHRWQVVAYAKSIIRQVLDEHGGKLTREDLYGEDDNYITLGNDTNFEDVDRLEVVGDNRVIVWTMDGSMELDYADLEYLHPDDIIEIADRLARL